jgi:hypothetical protein
MIAERENQRTPSCATVLVQEATVATPELVLRTRTSSCSSHAIAFETRKKDAKL